MYLFISIFDGWCAIFWAAEVDNKAKQAADDGGNDLNARHVAENGVSGRAQLVR
jgi:hypothetical protein